MKRQIGRPSRYKAEYAAQAEKLCLLGATDAEMADFFAVSERAVNRWKLAHADFRQSIARGKMLADAEVAEKLFHRAKGYEHPAVKIFQVDGQIIEAPYTEHYPPDTPAASLWLRNRQPGKWRDKQETALTGPDGGAIQTIQRVIVDPAAD